MNSIYSSRPIAATPAPSLSTRVVSLVIHGAAAFVVVYAGASTTTAPLAADNESLTFVNFTPPEPPPPPDPVPPVPKEVLLSEPLPPPPITEVEPELVLAREEPKPEPEIVPEAPEPIIPEPPRRQPPVVQVGAFASAMVSAPAGPVKAIEDAGFDQADMRTSERSRAGAVVGAFDAAASDTARPGTGRSIGVADAGFGSGTAAPAGRNGSGRGVASSGFGSGSAAAAAPRAAGRVQASTFDAREAAAAKQVAQAVKQTPIEILSKPVPAYTDEARSMRVEGEVTLEVEFGAAGEIQVVRVVRGLGHGLDEMAARAVQGMRFKPAQRDGQPVATRTTVTIVFRLA